MSNKCWVCSLFRWLTYVAVLALTSQGVEHTMHSFRGALYRRNIRPDNFSPDSCTQWDSLRLDQSDRLVRNSNILYCLVSEFCGDTWIDLRGYQSSNITYTVLPSSYGEPSCSWIIQSHKDRIILLSVIHYEFENTGYTGDVLTIGYGNNTFNPESTLLIKHKDSAIFQNIAVVGPLVWIKFDSNNDKYDSTILLVASEEDHGKLSVLFIEKIGESL